MPLGTELSPELREAVASRRGYALHAACSGTLLMGNAMGMWVVVRVVIESWSFCRCMAHNVCGAAPHCVCKL